MWKHLINSKRCIVPARGFYEWKKLGDKKQPYYITLKDDSVMSFAGLYDHWKDSEGVEILSFTIITTTPNAEMSEIHDRMPVLLDKKKADIWLSPLPFEQDQLHDLLKPAPDASLLLEPVSTRVNYVGNNDRDLIYRMPS